jgi:hypothetical protein
MNNILTHIEVDVVRVVQGSSLTEGNRGKRSKRSGPPANGNHEDQDDKNVSHSRINRSMLFITIEKLLSTLKFYISLEDNLKLYKI